jgi:hypothetical protein
VTELYDRVEKRLFNVRNCRNIDGVFRDLPLYDPPIDPLLLIRAKAAGLSIDDAVGAVYAPLPNHRFAVTLPKALELAAELKALGGALLAAMEKHDGEGMSLMRSGQEIAMLGLVRDVRKQQIADADANTAALQQSEATVLERFGQFQKLLGKPGITQGPDGLPVIEQSSSLAVFTDPAGGPSGLGLSRREVDQLVLTGLANEFGRQANAIQLASAILSVIPNVFGGTPFAGQTFGGTNLGAAAAATAKAMEIGGGEATHLANLASTFAGYGIFFAGVHRVRRRVARGPPGDRPEGQGAGRSRACELAKMHARVGHARELEASFTPGWRGPSRPISPTPSARERCGTGAELFRRWTPGMSHVVRFERLVLSY